MKEPTKILSISITISLFVVCVLTMTSCETCDDPMSRCYSPSSRTSSSYNVDEGDSTKGDSMAGVALSKVNEVESKLASQSDSINGLYDKVNDLEKKNSLMIDKNSAYTFMVAEFVILLIIVCLLYRQIRALRRELSISQRNGSSENDVESMIRERFEDLVRQINNKNVKQDGHISELLERIKQLESQLNSYKLTFQPTQPYSETIIERERSVKEQTGNVFYMPRTMTSMQFEDSKKKYTRDETVCFTFTLIGKGKAKFIFEPYDESSVRRALDSREETLRTVCELEEINQSGKKFVNIEPGEAVLKDNIWEVTKKLRLKYV